MTDLALVIVTGGTLLVILGALIGQSLNEHLRDRQIRHQAAVQRQIGEEWRLLREERIRQHTGLCTRCGGPCSTVDDELRA